MKKEVNPAMSGAYLMHGALLPYYTLQLVILISRERTPMCVQKREIGILIKCIL